MTFPTLSHWLRLSPRPRFRITRAGWGWLLLAGVLLAISWLRNINLLMLLSYGMLTLWLLNFWHAGRRLHRLRVQRHLEGPIFANTPFFFRLQVSNQDRRPQWGLRLFEGPRTACNQDWFLPCLAAGASVTWTLRGTLPRRGRQRWACLTAVSGYPFGLVERRMVVSGEQEVIVLPRLGRLHRERLRRFLQATAPTSDGRRGTTRLAYRLPAELHGIRPFQTGDSPRWIHWRSSARHGELMVREFEPAVRDHLILVVDLQTGTSAVGERTNQALPAVAAPPLSALVEETVSLAATLCWEGRQQRDSCLVLAVAGSTPKVLQATSACEHALHLLECLADLQGHTDSCWKQLLPLLAGDALPPGPVLVVSPQQSALVAVLADHLRRPVAHVRADELDAVDFYERPAFHVG